MPDTYVRIVHADDLVPHMPTRVFGFRHAGNEVWYKSGPHDGKYTECIDEPGKLIENKNCSNSLIITTSIKNHKQYMGVDVSKMCDKRQPSGNVQKTMDIGQKLTITLSSLW